MSKKAAKSDSVEIDDTVDVKPQKAKVTDLLAELDEAFDTAGEKAEYLAKVRATAAERIADAQTELDTVKAEQQKYIMKAEQEAQDARTALEKLRAQVNERVGSLTGMGSDSRVSVR